MNAKLIAQCLESIAARNRLQQKLHPQRFPGMTPLMAALVGFILDVSFVSPNFAEVAVMSDGFVLASTQDTVNIFIGTYQDLLRNWVALLAAARLTEAERQEADMLFAAKIGYFGRTTA
jgi:hypothetical protein